MWLTEKYAPKVFEDLWGQTAAGRIMGGLIVNNCPRHLSLVGALGSGKTTSAGIFAKAINCSVVDPSTGSPCNNKNSDCPGCSDPSQYFHARDVPVDSETKLSLLLEWLNASIEKTPAKFRPVIFLDEAHWLAAHEQDALLKITEDSASRAIFIFATTRPQKLNETLSSRLQTIEFYTLSLKQSLEFVNHILDREDRRAEPAAIRLIAVTGCGFPRRILNVLGQVCTSIPIHEELSEGHVRACLSLQDDQRLLEYFHSLLDNDIAAPTRALEGWARGWSSKARWVEAFLLRILNDVLGQDTFVDPLVDGYNPAVIQKMIKNFREHWNVDQPDFVDRWRTLMSVWSRTDRSRSDIDIRFLFVEFEAAIRRPTVSTGQIAVYSQAKIEEKSAKSANPFPVERLHSNSGFITVDDVRTLVERASFFVQEHGRLFNFALVHRPSENARDDTSVADKDLHDFVQALHATDYSKSKARAAILLMSRDENGVHGRLCGYLEEAKEQSEFGNRVRELAASRGGTVTDLETSARRGGKELISFHWDVVADLARGLDKGPEDKLRQALKVPKYREVGPIRSPHALLRFYGGTRSEAIERAGAIGMRFHSVVADGALHHLRDGWEIAEHQIRKQALQRLQRDGGSDETFDFRRLPRGWNPWWISDDARY